MKQLLKVCMFMVFCLANHLISSKTPDVQRYEEIVHKFEDPNSLSTDDLQFFAKMLSKKIDFLKTVIDEFKNYDSKKEDRNLHYEKFDPIASTTFGITSEESKLLRELELKKAGVTDGDIEQEDAYRLLVKPSVEKQNEYKDLLKNVKALLQQKEKSEQKGKQPEKIDTEPLVPETIEYSFKYSADDEKRIEDLLGKIDEPGAVSQEALEFLQNKLPHKLTFIETVLRELDKKITDIDPTLKIIKVVPSPQDAEKLDVLKTSLAQAIKHTDAGALSLIRSEYGEEKENYNELLGIIKNLLQKADADQQQKRAELEKAHAAEQEAQEKKLAEEAAAKKRATQEAEQAAQQASAAQAQKLAEEEVLRKKIEEEKQRAAQEQRQKEKDVYENNLKKYIQESRKTLINNLNMLLNALNADEKSIVVNIGKPELSKVNTLPINVQKYLSDIVEGLHFANYGVLYNQAVLLRRTNALNKRIKELRATVQKMLRDLK